jgi:hypothetical protein
MNPLYNKLMAEKGAPRAANNPNTTQLRGAPMNLRSAMNKYAMGGNVELPPPSAGDINSFVQANMGNPQAIMQAAAQYNVSMEDLANATGYSSNQINDYFSNAGLGSMGTRSIPPQLAGSGTFNVPSPEDIPKTVMPNEGWNEPVLDEGYGYGPVPEYRGKLDDPLISQNPPMFSPDPNPISGRKNLDPVISPELLRKLQESMNNPFGSQVTQQDQIMKLLQSLGMK